MAVIESHKLGWRLRMNRGEVVVSSRKITRYYGDVLSAALAIRQKTTKAKGSPATRGVDESLVRPIGKNRRQRYCTMVHPPPDQGDTRKAD